MRILIYILFIFFLTNSFSQKKNEFKDIKNIEYFKEEIIDTLKYENWSSLEERRKIMLREYIIESNKRITNDTSKTSIVYYYGKKDTLKIESPDLKTKNLKLDESENNNNYRISYCYPTDQKVFKLLEFPRNGGIKKIKIYFIQSKRVAEIEIDTKYPEVYIDPEFDIELVDFDEENFGKEVDENGLPIPTSKLVKMEDKIMVDHKYSGNSHGL